MADNVERVGIEFVAEMSAWRAEVAKLPRDTDEQLKAMAAVIDKRMASVERSFKKGASGASGAKKETTAYQQSMERASRAAGDAGQRIQRLGGFLDQLAPGLGQATQLGADFGDVIEVGAEGLGALGLVAGGAAAGGLASIAVVYAKVTREGRLAADVTDTYRRANVALEPTLRKIIDAELELSVALGYTTEAEARQEKARTDAQRGVKDFGEGLRDQRAELRANIDQAQGWLNVVNAIIPAEINLGGMAADAVFGWSDSIEAANTQLGALDEKERENAANTKHLRDVTQAAAAATDDKKDGDEAARKAAELRAEAERKLAEALRRQEEAGRQAAAASAEDSQLTATYTAGLERLRAAADDAADARLTGEAKIRDDLEEKLAALKEEYQLNNALAATDRDRIASLVAYKNARVEMVATAEAEITRLKQEEAKKQEEAYAAAASSQMDMISEVGSYAEQGVGMLAESFEAAYQASAEVAARLEAQLAASEAYLTDAQKKNLEKRIALAKDAAEQQFEAAKNAKAAEAMMSTFLAAINAVAQSPPPSPLGLAGAAIATGLGVAAVASIESQQFTAYTGGMPDEVPATLHRDEAVLSRQARGMIGDDAINRLNAGMSALGQTVDVRFVYGHREYDMAIASTVVRGGRLRRAVTGAARTAPTGHGDR